MVTIASLSLQGCQNGEAQNISDDDWIVGSWTTLGICTDEGIQIKANGVWMSGIEVGAWRLRSNELILTTIFDGGSEIQIGNEFGIDPSEIDNSVVRFKIVSHDSNKSMVTSMADGGRVGQATWLNCDKVAKADSFVDPAQPIAPPSPPAPAAISGNSNNSAVSDPQAPYSEELTCRGYLYDMGGGLGLALKLNQRGDPITSNEACNAYIENETPAFRARVLSACRVGSTCTIRGRVAMSQRATYYWWQSIADVGPR